MPNKTPQISVGMPVYNGEPYLEQAIRSVLEQTYGDFELVIADNASTDRTSEICRQYAAQDGRIRYSRNPRNIGAAANFRRVFELSGAPFFRWATADDLSGPRLHELCLRMLEQHPDAVLVYGKTQIVDGAGRFVEDYEDHLDLQQPRASERFKRYFESVGLCNAIYGLMRRSALARTSLMGDGSIPAADIRLMAELTLCGKFIEIPDPMFFRRMHEAASSWNRKDQERQQQFWSAGSKRFTLPHWRTNYGYLCKALALPLEFSERGRIIFYIMRRTLRQRRKLAADVIQFVRQRT